MLWLLFGLRTCHLGPVRRERALFLFHAAKREPAMKRTPKKAPGKVRTGLEILIDKESQKLEGKVG